MSGWIGAYERTPPWDIGHPQGVVVELYEGGDLTGRVLDVGCGTGENAIYLASRGSDVVGIDFTQRAIEIAQVKSFERDEDVEFLVGDVLELDYHFREAEFDGVLGSGLFHTLTDEERPIYVEQVARVLTPGGSFFMLCFSVKQPGMTGPRRLSMKEITESFQERFRINYIRDAVYESNVHDPGAKGYLVSATRLVSIDGRSSSD
ncbi:MAG: class I SAM-dependent methyltransferase [Candidatus Thorarchaeota archaeon]|jgi:ubiquinone/menaquinone biosynthesis C-methylase UbiE